MIIYAYGDDWPEEAKRGQPIEADYMVTIGAQKVRNGWRGFVNTSARSAPGQFSSWGVFNHVPPGRHQTEPQAVAAAVEYVKKQATEQSNAPLFSRQITLLILQRGKDRHYLWSVKRGGASAEQEV